MKLTIVGSGDAFGSGGRLQTCYHVGLGGEDDGRPMRFLDLAARGATSDLGDLDAQAAQVGP